jgi:hypothetical protein
MSGQNGLAYGPAPGITWLKDAEQTILVDGLGGKSWILHGLEAAAWDLMALGYSFEGVAGFLALLAGVDDEQGRMMLLATVRRWQGVGLLCAAEGKPL